ncbi:MAG: hypothetical protein U1E65_18875 [Myxococcota bacterium]
MPRRPHLTLILGALFASWSGTACQTRCARAEDCGDEGFCRGGQCELECYSDLDCTQPPECRDSPISCVPRGLRCTSRGHCIGGVTPKSPTPIDNPKDPVVDVPGWDDPTGTGHAFVVDHLSIAAPGHGMNVDDRCQGPGDCVDNKLAMLGQLANDQINQGLISGETLLLVELAGLDPAFRGNQDALTVKLYSGHDADNPIDVNNNFQPTPGQNRCCEFKANPGSLNGPGGQPGARSAAKIDGGLLKSLVPVTMNFTLTVGRAPHPEIALAFATISAEVPSNLQTLRVGMLGGAIPMAKLAAIDNPYCGSLSSLCPRGLTRSSILDMLSTLVTPDIDLDDKPDGLEQVVGGANGRISTCIDGDGSVIGPQDPAQPWTCALEAEMRDGYSIGLNFSAVAATVVGIGQ